MTSIFTRHLRDQNHPMSALGHKRTCAVQNGMSALPPKADMCSATRGCPLVPIADIAPLQEAPRILPPSVSPVGAFVCGWRA